MEKNDTKTREGEISYEQFLAIVRRFFPHVVKVKEVNNGEN